MYIILTILMFGLLILFHELGHFATARLFKVTVNEFAIGMGPKLISKKSGKSGITYSLRALPIGGYVSMEGENIRGNTPEENTNWRSNSDVVKFNNSMFTQLVSTLSDVSVVDDNRSVGLGDIYGNVIQRVKNADKPGYVEVSLYKTATNGIFKGRGQKVYDSMGDLVQSLLAKGYEQKDIAFLVDTNSQGE